MDGWRRLDWFGNKLGREFRRDKVGVEVKLLRVDGKGVEFKTFVVSIGDVSKGVLADKCWGESGGEMDKGEVWLLEEVKTVVVVWKSGVEAFEVVAGGGIVEGDEEGAEEWAEEGT